MKETKSMNLPNSEMVVIGGGQAAAQLCESLRAKGHKGSLTLVSDEAMLPYCRPALSKQYLVGTQVPDWLLYRPESFYANHDIRCVLGDRAVMIDRSSQHVQLASGQRLHYDGLALVTGSRARRLGVPGDENVRYVRVVADSQYLRDRLPEAARVVVIGGGFIGLEVAAILVQTGRTVTLLTAGEALLPRSGTGVLSDFLKTYHAARGVRIVTQVRVAEVRTRGDGSAVDVVCEDGNVYLADLVIAGIGVHPNIELAESAGLQCQDGIIVDEACRTSDKRIVAAGDCTRHPNAASTQPLRLETVHNSVEQAKSAAASLLGQVQPYRQTPWVWSDQYGLRLQFVGLRNGADHCVQRGRIEEASFSLFYFRAGQFIGMECVNRPADFGVSRRLLNEGIALHSEQASNDAFALDQLLPSKHPLVFESPWPVRLSPAQRAELFAA